MSENAETSALQPSEQSIAVSEKSADPLAWLAPPEREALQYFESNRHKPGSRYASIATSVALQMFNLYLSGRSLREIWEQNRQAFSFGQVVHAAVEGRWDEHRQEYLQGLYSKAAQRADQVVGEGVQFVGDMMTAAHRLHGDALKKFIQTGNPADLGAFGISSVRQYKEAVELMLKLSGKDKIQKVQGQIQHEHTVRSIPLEPPKPVSPDSASNLLSAWGKEELEKLRQENG